MTWHQEQQRLENQRAAAAAAAGADGAGGASRPKPKSWAETAAQGQADADAESAANQPVEDGRSAEEAASAWGLGRIMTWPDGTARAVFCAAEHELALMQGARQPADGW